MENKQTAVEWLKEQMHDYDHSPVSNNEEYVIIIPVWIFKDKFNTAKQMEKEQIAKAWNDGDYAYFYSKETGKDFENGEQYYNETYGK